MAYQRPMVTVDQNMTIAPTSIERDQPALIFGPSYELHRYSDAAEKESAYFGLYDDSKYDGATPKKSMTGDYPNVIDASKVDKDYTKLFGDNVVIELAKLGAGSTISLPENDINADQNEIAKNGGYTLILFEGKRYVEYDIYGNRGDLSDGLNRSLAAGDQVIVKYSVDGTAGELFTKIVDARYSGSSWELDDSSSNPEGAAGTLVTIADSIPNIGTVSVTGVSLVDVADGVEFTKRNYQTATGYQWELTSSGVKVNALNAYDYSYSETGLYKVLYADLYVQYRELKTEFADTFHSVTGASQVANMLGTIDKDNPLAMGVYMAALNSATDDGDEAPPVYFMEVGLDSSGNLDWAAVLNKASQTDRAYVFAPTTRDKAVLDLLESHAIEMSTKTVKRWRIGSASAEVPDTVAVLKASDNIGGHDYYAGLVTGTTNVIRVFNTPSDGTGSDETEFRTTLHANDKVVITLKTKNGWGEYDTLNLTVKQSVNNNTFEVNESVEASELTDKCKIEIYHEYTSSEHAEVIASVSRRMASRRMLNVFPPSFEAYGTEMTGEFMACAVAGLISATEPQQPITNMPIRGVDRIPLTYQRYSNADLDVIASGGTFIVTQDLPDDIVYVRHQITTAYPDGNINTAELSITKNVDSISYAFSELYRPYYGKYNITPELVAILENLAGQLISQLGGSTSVYGPQLITENTRINYVRQNELLKDHVDISISLGVPYPCNNIDIVLTV